MRGATSKIIGNRIDEAVAASPDSRTGWFVVAAAFLSMFTVFGVAYSFGAFFGSMADDFGTDRASTALFFSITTFLYFTLGMVSGRVADRIGPRAVVCFGAVAMGIGLWLTSSVSSITQGYVTYGLGVGIGVACGYVPMVAAVGGWFEERRSTALGVAVAGIGLGTLIAAPAMERLIAAYGWRTTYRILAGLSVVLLLVASAGAIRAPGSAAAKPAPIREALRGRRDFFWLYMSSLALTMTLFVPFVFLGDYLMLRSIAGSGGLLVGLIGVASIVGRLGLGALASRFRTMALYRVCFVVLALSYLLWLWADNGVSAERSYAVLVVFAIVLGVAYGGFIALSPAVVAERFGVVGMGSVLGTLYSAAGFGGLFGPPLAGWLIDNYGYTATLAAAMAVGVIATICLIGVPTNANSLT